MNNLIRKHGLNYHYTTQQNEHKGWQLVNILQAELKVHGYGTIPELITSLYSNDPAEALAKRKFLRGVQFKWTEELNTNLKTQIEIERRPGHVGSVQPASHPGLIQAAPQPGLIQAAPHP